MCFINEKMFIDKFGLSSDRSGNTYSYSVKIEGDYVFLLDDNFLVPRSEYICFVYKKSDEKIPEDWQKYPSDW